ncbi:MAG: alpha-beta hydrolase superfamily lysophospholipase [Maribacter sp.]|jgi:alpha-beta hydrolase superfamily lysophospholipase
MSIVVKFGIGIILTISLSAVAQNKNEQYKRVETEIVELINSPDPTFDLNALQQPMSPEAIADIGFEQVYQNSAREFSMRDGKQLFSYAYNKKSDTTIILVHGVLSGAYMMNKTAGLLQETTHNEVIALDLRGHGQSEGTPGDVDYVNQYVDDLEDVVSAIKKEKPNQNIVLAGHSMGGGIILRYAMEKDAPEVDGYLLFAPHLGANAPTLKEEVLKTSEAPFVKLNINRIIGLKMMNAIGVSKYNDLPVLFFNLPETMPVTKYSYRANESMSPSDYQEGLNAIAKPLLVLVGSKDEAFDAGKFNTAITENSNGEVYTVKDETHNGIRHNKKSMELISNWINHNNLQ